MPFEKEMQIYILKIKISIFKRDAYMNNQW